MVGVALRAGGTRRGAVTLRAGSARRGGVAPAVRAVRAPIGRVVAGLHGRCRLAVSADPAVAPGEGVRVRKRERVDPLLEGRGKRGGRRRGDAERARVALVCAVRVLLELLYRGDGCLESRKA